MTDIHQIIDVLTFGLFFVNVFLAPSHFSGVTAFGCGFAALVVNSLED